MNSVRINSEGKIRVSGIALCPMNRTFKQRQVYIQTILERLLKVEARMNHVETGSKIMGNLERESHLLQNEIIRIGVDGQKINN